MAKFKSQKHFTQKYLEAFPFSRFSALKGPGPFCYIYEKEGRRLLHLYDPENHESLEKGEKLLDVDFNKQWFWHLENIGDYFYFISDTSNEEDFNIFCVHLKTKKMEQLTFNKYTACIHLTDEPLAYYASRNKDKKGRFENEIYIHDLKSGKRKMIVDDKDDLYRIGWGPIVPARGEDFLFVPVDKNSERSHGNICLIEIQNQKKKLLIPPELESSDVFLVEDEIDMGTGFYFTSDCSGFHNLYYYDFKTERTSQLTWGEFMTDGFSFVESKGIRYFYQTKTVPSEGKTYILTYKEESSGVVTKIDQELVFEGEVSLNSQKQDILWVGESHLTQPPRRMLYRMKNSKWECEHEVAFYAKSSEGLVHSTYEYIQYSSFDGLKVPGYLVIPNRPIKGAVITAFYGGGNDFNWNYQMMAELGFATLSPAVRGSWGHGKEWEDMIKGDLGGAEILDLLWGAKFLEKKLGLVPSQIGVEGGSHGGYATLRALTLPKNFKNQDSQYPFGFGICWAGFADLVKFYQYSNIPDWLSNMLGPYEGREELYAERSPVNFFDELKAPLFISHGTKDSRVPPVTMEAFLEKLKKSDKPHYIYFMDGQGHTGGSIDERVDEFKTLFNFLEKTTGLGWLEQGKH